MTCEECVRPLGEFGLFVPVFRINLITREPEQVGYVHLWHLQNAEES